MTLEPHLANTARPPLAKLAEPGLAFLRCHREEIFQG